MSFSIKNIFQKGGPGDQGGAATLESQPSSGGAPQAMSSPFSAGKVEAGGFGGGLFRTVGGEGMDGAPVAPQPGGSPFSPFGAGNSMVLTVGDLLPQIPPEIARANGALPDQPVPLAPDVLENAISSGQLAVPVFEIYRVCPALFQAPVSPHDPRMIPLPKGKLPGMIATHTGALMPSVAAAPSSMTSSPPPMPGASPFAMPSMQSAPSMMPQAPMSPFAPALPDLPGAPGAGMQPQGSVTSGIRPAGGALPPRRPQGVPPAIPTQADFMGAAPMPGNFSLPGAPQDPSRPASRPMMAPPQAGASPFAAMAMEPMQSPPSAPPMQMPGATSLLFGNKPQGVDPELESSPASPPPMASPFGAPPTGASPFGQSPFGMPPAGQQPQQPPASPFSAPAGASPFASPPVASFEVPASKVPSGEPKLGNLPFAAQAMPQPMAMPPASAPMQQPMQPMPGARPSTRPASRPMSRPISRPMGSPVPSYSGSQESMEVSLAAVLKGQTAQDLGFDPSFIPGWITTKLPAAEIRSQLPSGQVVLDLGTIIDGTDSTFKSVIAHGRRAFNVSIPTSEVFSTMPPMSGSANAAPSPQPSPFAAPAMPQAAPSPFMSAPLQQPQPSPFAAGAQPSPFMSQAPSPSPFAPPAEPAPFAPVAQQPSPFMSQAPSLAPFAQSAEPSPFAAQQPRPTPTGPLQPMSNFSPFGAQPSLAPPPVAPSMSDFGSSRPMEAPMQPPAAPPMFGLGSEQLFGAPPATPAPMFPSAPAAQNPSTRPFASLPGASPMPEIKPEVPAFAPVLAMPKAPTQPMAPSFAPTRAPSQPMQRSAPAPAAAGNQFGINAMTDTEQMMLRALLGVSDRVDIQRLVEMTTRLDGVSACACVRGLKMIAHGDDSRQAQEFRQQAGEIARSMRMLAELTGMAAETLTLPTPDRTITFCFQGENAFGVLHSTSQPPAGLREKVTLLGREAASMPV